MKDLIYKIILLSDRGSENEYEFDQPLCNSSEIKTVEQIIKNNGSEFSEEFRASFHNILGIHVKTVYFTKTILGDLSHITYQLSPTCNWSETENEA